MLKRFRCCTLLIAEIMFEIDLGISSEIIRGRLRDPFRGSGISSEVCEPQMGSGWFRSSRLREESQLASFRGVSETHEEPPPTLVPPRYPGRTHLSFS
jgi:hypothetical protein